MTELGCCFGDVCEVRVYFFGWSQVSALSFCFVLSVVVVGKDCNLACCNCLSLIFAATSQPVRLSWYCVFDSLCLASYNNLLSTV